MCSVVVCLNFNKEKMRYHIVSDNLYFLLGVRGVLQRNGVCAFIYSSYEYSTSELMSEMNSHLKPGDVLVFALRNTVLRRNVLRLPCLVAMRILFVSFFPVTKKISGSLPWIIGGDTTGDIFFFVLKEIISAKNESYKRITGEHMAAIDFLTSGETVNNLSVTTGWSAKKLYYQRIALLRKCGLSGTTEHEILLCRDILTLLRRQQTKNL